MAVLCVPSRKGRNVEAIVGDVNEAYQTVHIDDPTELSDDDRTEVFTDIHFWERSPSLAHEAYHLSYSTSSTTPRVFYYIFVYTVASIDTQCIDSNLESGRYISRVRATAVAGSL